MNNTLTIATETTANKSTYINNKNQYQQRYQQEQQHEQQYYM